MQIRKTFSLSHDVVNKIEQYRKLGFRDESQLVEYCLKKMLLSKKEILKARIQDLNRDLAFYTQALRDLEEIEIDRDQSIPKIEMMVRA